MIQDAQSNLRGIIGKMDLNEVLNGTEEINVALFTSIKDITAGMGWRSTESILVRSKFRKKSLNQ